MKINGEAPAFTAQAQYDAAKAELAKAEANGLPYVALAELHEAVAHYARVLHLEEIENYCGVVAENGSKQ